MPWPYNRAHVKTGKLPARDWYNADFERQLETEIREAIARRLPWRYTVRHATQLSDEELVPDEGL